MTKIGLKSKMYYSLMIFLFLALTLVLIVCGLGFYESWKRSEWSSLGGTVSVGYPFLGDQVSVSLGNAPGLLVNNDPEKIKQALRKIKHLPNHNELRLSSIKLSESDLIDIIHSFSPKELRLVDISCGDQCLLSLCQSSRLEVLYLVDCPVTCDGLVELVHCERLESIEIGKRYALDCEPALLRDKLGDKLRFSESNFIHVVLASPD